MKTFLRSIAEKILATLIGGTILTWIFYPDIFSKGISSIDLLSYMKILLGVGVFFAWIHIIVYFKTKDIINDINKLRTIIKDRTRDHFYTTDDKERVKAIERYGYNDEDISCYVYPVGTGKNIEGTVPLYRLYCPK